MIESPKKRDPKWMRDEAYRTLGFSLAQHPVGLLRHQLPSRLVTTRDLEFLPNGPYVQIPAMVVCRQRPETAHGITFMSVEDEFGLYNVIVYPDLYEAERNIVRSAAFLIVTGRLQIQDNNINLIATKLASVDMQVMRNRPSWLDEEDDRSDDFDVANVKGRSEILTRADILRVRPKVHSYH